LLHGLGLQRHAGPGRLGRPRLHAARWRHGLLLHRLTLETGGIQVGDVVGAGIQAQLRGLQAG